MASLTEDSWHVRIGRMANRTGCRDSRPSHEGECSSQSPGTPRRTPGDARAVVRHPRGRRAKGEPPSQEDGDCGGVECGLEGDGFDWPQWPDPIPRRISDHQPDRHIRSTHQPIKETRSRRPPASTSRRPQPVDSVGQRRRLHGSRGAAAEHRVGLQADAVRIGRRMPLGWTGGCPSALLQTPFGAAAARRVTGGRLPGVEIAAFRQRLPDEHAHPRTVGRLAGRPSHRLRTSRRRSPHPVSARREHHPGRTRRRPERVADGGAADGDDDVPYPDGGEAAGAFTASGYVACRALVRHHGCRTGSPDRISRRS